MKTKEEYISEMQCYWRWLQKRQKAFMYRPIQVKFHFVYCLYTKKSPLLWGHFCSVFRFNSLKGNKFIWIKCAIHTRPCTIALTSGTVLDGSECVDHILMTILFTLIRGDGLLDVNGDAVGAGVLFESLRIENIEAGAAGDGNEPDVVPAHLGEESDGCFSEQVHSDGDTRKSGVVDFVRQWMSRWHYSHNRQVPARRKHSHWFHTWWTKNQCR